MADKYGKIEGDLNEIREMIFRRIILAFIILGFITYIPSLYVAIVYKFWIIAAVDTVAYSIIILFWFNTSIRIQIKVLTTLIIFLAIGILLLLQVGPLGAGYLWLFAVPLIAAVLLEYWYSIAALGVNILLLIIFGFLQSYEILEWNKAYSFPLTVWVVISVNFILLNCGATLPLALFIERLKRSLLREKEIAFKLTQERKELLKAKMEAENADRLKSEFLAQMSHEVRSPINTILNFVYLIKDETPKPLSSDAEFSFNAIENSSRRLIRTIDLILNMSQVQTGRMECKYQVLDIEKDVLANVITEFSTTAALKNLKLGFSNDAAISSVKADSYTVNQIFANLVDNAIKYTKSGEVSVRLYQTSPDYLFVDVCDTGIGISDQYINQLFTPFSQEEQGYSRKYDGNGLGLALVKKYCELNNAEVTVNSRKGEGTTFTVKFPIAVN
ncbi:MAG: sensor histidine kinase [Ignavibacteriales bacterium]